MGYHYPRSYQTRIQSKIGLPNLRRSIKLNKVINNNLIYILKKSLIDYKTYKVMLSSNLKQMKLNIY